MVNHEDTIKSKPEGLKLSTPRNTYTERAESTAGRDTVVYFGKGNRVVASGWRATREQVPMSDPGRRNRSERLSASCSEPTVCTVTSTRRKKENRQRDISGGLEQGGAARRRTVPLNTGLKGVDR